MVSLASPLAVMVGKKTVAVPLVFLGEVPPPPPPGDIMVKGDMLPNLAISSIKPAVFPNGELARFAEVGRPWEVRGNAPPTMVWGEGGGRVGVLGKEPGMGGARVKGEYTCPGPRKYGSAGVRRVGVIGVTPLVAQALKKVGLLNIPGEIGIALCGNTNCFPASLAPLINVGCWGGCSEVGGVALPLLMESLL